MNCSARAPRAHAAEGCRIAQPTRAATSMSCAAAAAPNLLLLPCCFHLLPQVLSDEGARSQYNAQLEVALQDEEDDFTNEPLSKWIPASHPKMAKNEDPAENRAVFVVSAHR